MTYFKSQPTDFKFPKFLNFLKKYFFFFQKKRNNEIDDHDDDEGQKCRPKERMRHFPSVGGY